MAMAPRKMAIRMNGTPTHMRTGHVDMLMTFDPNHPIYGGKLLKLQQGFFLSPCTGAMKREQMISAIQEADKDPSKLIELVKKHVSRHKT